MISINNKIKATIKTSNGTRYNEKKDFIAT
jgi:hypothetical protein